MTPRAEKRKRPVLVLIPLGGLGQRFSDAGHTVPKPLIQALGTPILYWLLRSLTLEGEQHIVSKVVIPYHPDLARYRFEDRLRKDFAHIPFHFLPLTGNTRGAADTLAIALESLPPNQPDMPIISLDGDNFYSTDVLSLWNGRDAILTFQDFDSKPIYSYVKTKSNTDKTIVEIKEKVKISNLACTGAYGFQSWKQLLQFAKETLSNEKYMQKNEFYISSCIALMMEDDKIAFQAAVVPKESYICLGTPLQLRAFCNDFPRRNVQGEVVIKPRRYCFDLDNTLVTFPKVSGDYTTVEPITYMIDYVKYLKKFDHVIIIYTARRMLTHKGNVSAAMADIGKITFDTLDKFDIPYDEICFGKPQADYYIDDLAVSAYSDVEKALGFYRSHVEPRVFNDLSKPKSMELIRKASNVNSVDSALAGEIYFYNHIPVSVKDCFPIMTAYDQNNAWYDVEQIKGSTVSSLLLSAELTPSVLTSIMETLNRIHVAVEEVHEAFDVDIYANYSKKLALRYEKYADVYAQFPKSSQVHASLMQELQKYETEGRGKMAVIHGDPVLSNILVNSFGKIKLIDMRGKLGDVKSIRGDELYDWAKLYQSLIGYDEILQGRQTVTEKYRQELLECFWNNLASFSSDNIRPQDVKLITQSLLFSLIPLHSGGGEVDKQHAYYGLMMKCEETN